MIRLSCYLLRQFVDDGSDRRTASSGGGQSTRRPILRFFCSLALLRSVCDRMMILLLRKMRAPMCPQGVLQGLRLVMTEISTSWYCL